MEKLKTNYKNGERFYAEDMNLITSTINEIEDAIPEVISSDVIEDVSILPDAEQNKKKFVRLASDKKVYVSELVGTETWTWKEVVNEYQAGDGIDISNGVISATGGNAIEEVSELPEASENKDKLFRLDNGDKDVYVAKLLSSETITTNRLPDAQQIDRGYMYEDEGDAYYYKGAWKLILSDGEIDGFAWSMDENSYLFTLTNCVDTTLETLYGDFDSESWNVSGNTASTSDYSVSGYKNDMEYSLTVFGIKAVIPAIYNVPESVQIGNATLDTPSEIEYVYDGSVVTTTINDEQFTGYKWLSEDNPNGYLLTNKQASNIYYHLDSDNNAVYSDVKYYEYDGSDITDVTIRLLDIQQLNAPDSEQVDNAYINCNDGNEFFPDTIFNYTGVRKTLVVSDGSLYAYLWGEDTIGTPGNWGYATTVPANEIYSKGKVCLASLDDYSWTISSDDTLTNLEISLTDLEENNIIPIGEDGETVSIVKYQRTEVTEEWDWEDILECGGTKQLMQEVTYAELKSLRDNKQLVPGQQYRITDYVTTTAQANTQSTGHPFDIIVVADSEDKLNENARAINHSGDTYFANSKLESWELKYCLDNDTNRFSWAQAGFAAIQTDSEDGTYLSRRYPDLDANDMFAWCNVANSENVDWDDATIDWDDMVTNAPIYTLTDNPSIGDKVYYSDGTEISGVDIINYSANKKMGKGVIYHMKDEWNNRVYFDFKNIRIYSSGDDAYICLFGGDVVDYTLTGEATNNLVEGKNVVDYSGDYTISTLTLDTTQLIDSEHQNNYQGQLIYIPNSQEVQTLQVLLEWMYGMVN